MTEKKKKPRRPPILKSSEAEIKARVEDIVGLPFPPGADLVGIARRYERVGRVLRDWLKSRGITPGRRRRR